MDITKNLSYNEIEKLKKQDIWKNNIIHESNKLYNFGIVNNKLYLNDGEKYILHATKFIDLNGRKYVALPATWGNVEYLSYVIKDKFNLI